MKLTKSKLKQIIKEEIHTLIESPGIDYEEDIKNIMTQYLQADKYKDWDESEKWQYAEFLVPLKNLIEHWGNENVIIKSILDYWKRVVKHDYDDEEDKFTAYGKTPEDAAQDWLDHIVPLTPGQPKGEDNAFAQATWGGDELGPPGMANEWEKIEAKYKTLWAKIQPHVHYAVDFWKSPHKVSQEDFWNAVHKRLHLEGQKQKLKQIIKEELSAVLKESRIKSVEATSIEDAESLMDPMYRAHSFSPQSSFIEEDTQLFIVTLANGEKIIAQLRNGEIDLHDLEDREINDEALAQEILLRFTG